MSEIKQKLLEKNTVYVFNKKLYIKDAMAHIERIKACATTEEKIKQLLYDCLEPVLKRDLEAYMNSGEHTNLDQEDKVLVDITPMLCVLLNKSETN